MELSIIRRETTGAAPNLYNESETITKFEIMDGAPVRGETIPIRLFLGGFELTPTFRDVNKKFSTRYYLNLVLIDEENRRYFKQQEITVFRIPSVVVTGCARVLTMVGDTVGKIRKYPVRRHHYVDTHSITTFMKFGYNASALGFLPPRVQESLVLTRLGFSLQYILSYETPSGPSPAHHLYSFWTHPSTVIPYTQPIHVIQLKITGVSRSIAVSLSNLCRRGERDRFPDIRPADLKSEACREEAVCNRGNPMHELDYHQSGSSTGLGRIWYVRSHVQNESGENHEQEESFVHVARQLEIGIESAGESRLDIIQAGMKSRMRLAGSRPAQGGNKFPTQDYDHVTTVRVRFELFRCHSSTIDFVLGKMTSADHHHRPTLKQVSTSHLGCLLTFDRRQTNHSSPSMRRRGRSKQLQKVALLLRSAFVLLNHHRQNGSSRHQPA